MFETVALSKYLGILGMLLAAGFGFPIPEEIPIVTAGAFVGHDSVVYHTPEMLGAVASGMASVTVESRTGLTAWYIMLPLCIVGVVVSDCVLFFVGRWFGPGFLKKEWVRKRILPPELCAKIEANFEKWGVMILLAARLAPGFRTPVFIMAGILRMPVSRFLLADGLYAIPGVNLLFWLSYWFTDQFVATIHEVDRHRPLAIAALLAAIGGIVLYKTFANRKTSTGDVDEIPRIVKPVGVVAHTIEQTIEKTVGVTVETAAMVVDFVTHPLGHSQPSPNPTTDPTTPKPTDDKG